MVCVSLAPRRAFFIAYEHAVREETWTRGKRRFKCTRQNFYPYNTYWLKVETNGVMTLKVNGVPIVRYSADGLRVWRVEPHPLKWGPIVDKFSKRFYGRRVYYAYSEFERVIG